MLPPGTARQAEQDVRPVLRGRGRELARLRDLINGIGSRGGALVLRGDAGIGKSALLAQATAFAAEHDLRIASTRGTPSEAQLAFAGIHQLLHPMLGVIGLLPAPQRRALENAFGISDAEASDLFLIGLAALGLIAETAADRPLVVVIEDAHWLDRSSLDVLTFVAKRIEFEPVAMVFAEREGVSPALGEAGLPTFEIDHLADPDAEAVLREVATLSPELERRVLAQADGNPLALIELSAAASRLEPDSPIDQALPLTARLERAFAARLCELDLDARTIALLAAIDDARITEVAEAAAITLQREPRDGAWASLTDANFGRVSGETFVFRHPLVASAVQQEASPERLRAAHTALAELLAEQPDRAIWHRAAATTAPDDDLARALEAAGERATRRGARDIGVSALEQAAGFSVDRGDRARRLMKAATGAFELGRWEQSLRLVQTVDPDELSTFDRLGRTHFLEILSGGWSGAETVCAYVSMADGLRDTAQLRVALEGIQSMATRFFFSQVDEATRRETAGILEGLDLPPDDPLLLSVIAQVDPLHTAGEVRSRIARLGPEQFDDPSALFAIAGATSATWADDLGEPYLHKAVDAFRREGRLAYLAQADVFLAWLFVRKGESRSAMTAAGEGIRLCEETGQHRYVLAAQVAEAISVADRGGDEVAERLVAEVESVLLPLGANAMLSLTVFARGRLALAAGRFGEAFEQLAPLFDAAHPGFQPFIAGWAIADLAEAAARVPEHRATARESLTRWRPLAESSGSPYLALQIAYADAVLRDDDAAHDRFLGVVQDAGADWPDLRARTQLAHGGWLRRNRRSSESRALLREAAHTFDALGRTEYAERARQELRASGESMRRRVPEAWAQLSPQELQIAQLAADGLTNREIGERLYLSHRTVGSHLYRLFPKLGITSRSQLAAVLATG
jgi:DNA-binding CsgD family transcriptional regulator